MILLSSFIIFELLECLHFCYIAACVSFTEDKINVAEGAGSVEVCVVVTGVLTIFNSAIDIGLSTEDVSSMSTSDK